jgi:hypothetical protein
MSTLHVAAIASDPGGANALAPVLRALIQHGVSVHGVASGPAVERWRINCPEVSIEAWDDASDAATARRYLESHRADRLVSAAGVCNQIEHTFRLAARDLQIPSVAVLDFWGRYSDRFSRWQNGVRSVCHPDRICVPDELSRTQMIQEGFAAEALIVTGLPHVEQTLHTLKSVTAEQRRAWRKKYEVPDDELAIVFFSDFLEQGYNTDEQDRLLLGYNQITTWQAVSGALDAVNRSIQRRAYLLVKPHPLEEAAILDRLVKQTTIQCITTRLIQAPDARELVAVADVVVGMISTLLFEAALVGKPVLSVQIGLRESGHADPLISNEMGYTIPVYDRPTLEAVLQRALNGDLTHAPEPRHPVYFEGATERVLTAVLGHGPIASA